MGKFFRYPTDQTGPLGHYLRRDRCIATKVNICIIFFVSQTMETEDLATKVQLARVLAILRQKQLTELESPTMCALVSLS